MRRRATLAAVLAKFVSRPRANIEDGLWRLLELGAYQLALLSGVPPHAAVSETVALAKDLGKPQWSGFLNGVLRNIARELTGEFDPGPTTRGVPIFDSPEAPHLVRFRRLGGEVFPDPVAQPAEYLAAAFSYPPWLVAGWLERLGWKNRCGWRAGSIRRGGCRCESTLCEPIGRDSWKFWPPAERKRRRENCPNRFDCRILKGRGHPGICRRLVQRAGRNRHASRRTCSHRSRANRFSTSGGSWRKVDAYGRADG